MSLRKRIDQNCKDCIYDSSAPGSWRQQVFLCCMKSCAFWDIRIKPISPIPQWTLRWYEVDLAEYQGLMATIEEGRHD